METTIIEKEVVSAAQTTIEKFFASGHDVQYVAEDAVYIDMGNSKETHGREAVKQFLHYMYHVAFDARAEITNKMFTDNKAAIEFNFRGKHIGEFAGIQPTGKEVNVPVCVVYDVENGLIKKARIYLLANTMIKQLTTE
jgi:steroid delta-isomerase-like uncharacterized protein